MSNKPNMYWSVRLYLPSGNSAFAMSSVHKGRSVHISSVRVSCVNGNKCLRLYQGRSSPLVSWFSPQSLRSMVLSWPKGYLLSLRMVWPVGRALMVYSFVVSETVCVQWHVSNLDANWLICKTVVTRACRRWTAEDCEAMPIVPWCQVLGLLECSLHHLTCCVRCRRPTT